MAKIFMDVGAHHGETALVAIESQFSFDRICCFEPSKQCQDLLKRISKIDPRIEINEFGLGAENGHRWLFDSGELGATLSTYRPRGTNEYIERVEIRDIADWLEHNLSPNDFVVMKLNCEGSEVEILERLLEKDKLSFFYTIVISWDIRDHDDLKPNARRELALRRKIRERNITNCCSSDDVLIGETHADRIRHWLQLFGVTVASADKDQLRKQFRKMFLKYSRKTGWLHRTEHRFKIIIHYEHFPPIMKTCLRSFKKWLRLNRDRKLVIK